MIKKNNQQKLTRSQEKTINKLVRSQEIVKRYLMFSGSETQAHWIPPLDYAEQHTKSAAQARVLRLAKCINLNEIFYISNKRGEPDLYKKHMDEFDRYIISHTSIGLNRSDSGEYTQSNALPLVVPMIFTKKKYKREEINFDRPYPIITVTSNGTTDRISVDSVMMCRMASVLRYIGSFEVTFTDECIDYILFGDYKKFLDHMIDSVEGLLEKMPYGAIERDRLATDLEIVVMKHISNYRLPYLNQFFMDPPSKNNVRENNY